MATEQSNKRHLTQIDFKGVENVLVTNWLHQINEKIYRILEIKPRKGTKDKKEIQYQSKD